MGTPWASIIAGTTAVFSAVATGGAWMAARRANSTAEAVARIERDRWHADLTPQFRVTLEPKRDAADLIVHLTGPFPLHHLDEIRVEVTHSDDRDHGTPPDGRRRVDPDEWAAQLWGPYELLATGRNEVAADGRTAGPFALALGNGRTFPLTRTDPPPWWTHREAEAGWRARWLGKPVRLVFTCRRDGFEPWVVPYEVEIPVEPQVF
jgi:hypothetical protein